MLASLLSRPCTSSTAKLSVCKDAVPLGAPFSAETEDRSISPSRSAIDTYKRKDVQVNRNWPMAVHKLFGVWAKKPWEWDRGRCRVPLLGRSSTLDPPLWCLCLFSSSLTPVRSPWLGLGDQEALGPTLCSWHWRLGSSPGTKNKSQVFIFSHSYSVTDWQIRKRQEYLGVFQED